MTSTTARRGPRKGKADVTLSRAEIQQLLAALGEAERLIGAVTSQLLKAAAPLARPGSRTWLLAYAEKSGGKPCGLDFIEKSGPRPCGVAYVEAHGPKPCGEVLSVEKSGPKPCAPASAVGTRAKR